MIDWNGAEVLIDIPENHLMNISRINRNIDDHSVKHIRTWKYQICDLNVLFASKYRAEYSWLDCVTTFGCISFEYFLEVLNKIFFHWIVQYYTNLGCVWQNQMLLRFLNWFTFFVAVYVQIILLILIHSNHFLLFEIFIFFIFVTDV